MDGGVSCKNAWDLWDLCRQSYKSHPFFLQRISHADPALLAPRF
jgi:hypothetical protein